MTFVFSVNNYLGLIVGMEVLLIPSPNTKRCIRLNDLHVGRTWHVIHYPFVLVCLFQSLFGLARMFVDHISGAQTA